MHPCAWGAGSGFWWVFPLVAIAMIALCFLVMGWCRRSTGAGCCPRLGRRPGDDAVR